MEMDLQHTNGGSAIYIVYNQIILYISGHLVTVLVQLVQY